MTEERKGQIALLIVKHALREKGVRLRPGFNREIAHNAKQIGIPTEEAVEFAVELYREATDGIHRLVSKASLRVSSPSIPITIGKCRKPG